MRWLHGNSSIYLSGINASYPLTLSVYTGGGGRSDVAKGRVVTLIVEANDYVLSPVRLSQSNQWYRWRLDQGVFQGGGLNLSFNVPEQVSSMVFWPKGVISEWLKLEPAVPPASISDFADLDWQQVFTWSQLCC